MAVMHPNQPTESKGSLALESEKETGTISVQITDFEDAIGGNKNPFKKQCIHERT